MYFSEKEKDPPVNEFSISRPIKTIQPFDNLYILVTSIDERNQKIFSTSSSMSSDYINLISYTVNSDGYIDFPFTGQIYVKDMTLNQSKEQIENKISDYLDDITITVKFVNNKVSVLGEVARPGAYSFAKDQLTIFEALGLAGGTTIYGKKNEIVLIREKNNKINYHYLDLTKKDIVSSDYYFVIPNDIIVIKPVKARFRTLNILNWSLVLSTITTAITLYLLFYRGN
jgi:polysaccharide export outer membrane protein